MKNDMQLNPKIGRSPSNRSLERGVEILRAFRPGSAVLGNTDLAERTGLPKSTVSRLTQTLVGAGMLQIDPASGGYLLAPAVLSLAHAMRSGSRILAIASPPMKALAKARKVNVGLAVADRHEMVYLESIRHGSTTSLRSIVSGQRVPMELTSLGRAHLASLPAELRAALLASFRARRRAQWPALEAEIWQAIQHIEQTGYCAASWQAEVVALATPVVVPATPPLVINISVSTAEPLEIVVQRHAAALLELAALLKSELSITRG